MTDDLSPAKTAIEETKYFVEDIIKSFEMSRANVLAIIPLHDEESNTIEKFIKNSLPNEPLFVCGSHLCDVIPKEFSCDEETLCPETFYNTLLKFLSILKAHVGVLADLECEKIHEGDDHHQKLQHFIKHKIPDLETGLERYRNDHSLSEYMDEQHTDTVDGQSFDGTDIVQKAYYIAIMCRLQAFTHKMCDLYDKLPK